MRKTILVTALVVFVPAAAFAMGLRIDLKALADKLLRKPDPNVEALLKMGIDPARAGFKEKPWWTFDPEDNLFRRTRSGGTDGVKPVKEGSPQGIFASQGTSGSAGFGPTGAIQLARQAGRQIEEAEKKASEGWQ